MLKIPRQIFVFEKIYFKIIKKFTYIFVLHLYILYYIHNIIYMFKLLLTYHIKLTLYYIYKYLFNYDSKLSLLNTLNIIKFVTNVIIKKEDDSRLKVKFI